MNAPQSMSQPAAPMPIRKDSVVMGRQDFVSVLLRLTGVELYRMRRRVMSKVLASITILAAVGIFVLNFVLLLLVSRNGTAPQDTLRSISDSLRLPTSLLLAAQTALTVERILLITLAAVIVGGEYGFGTVRLMFTRGPMRAQYLLAKIVALLICTILGLLVIVLLGLVTGQLLNLFTGFSQALDFLNAAWVGHALLYLLAVALGLFVYAMMALSFATLGRATAAGLAITLVWLFVVDPLLETLGFIGRTIRGQLGDLLAAVPSYLVSHNVSALIQNQSHYLANNDLVPLSDTSDLQALLVLVVYLALFIGLAWWVNEARDVTN